MNRISKRYVGILSFFILFSFVVSTTVYSSINKSNAQEAKGISKEMKSLREVAQERDVEESVRSSEFDWERDLDAVAQSSEVVILGKISDIKTSFDGDNWLRTDYTVDVQSILQPFTSKIPMELYALPGISFGNSLKMSRSGGSTIVNGHKVTQKNSGQEDLVKGKTYVFFLDWSPAYEAYAPVGGISGIVLVTDDLTVKPLASESKSKKANFKYNDVNLNLFIEQVLKKKIIFHLN